MSAFETKAWLQYYPDWADAQLPYGETTLLDVYEENLTRNADKPATYFFGRQMTFGDIDVQVRRAAAGLKAFGVRPGDRVAILLPNCPQHIIAFYAVLKLGAIVVEHNPLYTAHELEGPFRNHGARIAIVWDKAAPTVEKLREDTALETIVSVNMVDAMPRLQRVALRLPVPQLRKMRAQLTGDAPNTVPWDALTSQAIGGLGRNLASPEDITKDTTAVILYTSGTTGAPKGAELSHGNLYANIVQGKAWVKGLGDQPERMLAALPLFHAYGLTFSATLAFLIGGELILLPAPKMDLVMNVQKKHPITWIPGVPTLYEKIIEAAREKNVDLSSVRNSFSGAASLPEATVADWESMAGGLLVEGYGLTECSPILVGNPMTTDRRPGYIGVPFPDTEVRIANPENLDETMPDGEAGELVARAPQISKGYFNDPEATAEVFHNGWFRTGDMAIMEPDGYIKIVSRIKELIITGGFNVYPGEVESAMLAHPDIEEIAVVGRPRKDGSEDVVACVTLRDGAALDPEALKDYAREKLTRYKVPRTFYHFESLAKDQLGKIRRREVQADLLERMGEN
ncbi:long-chain fatty acid--CoA ligase [Corynebacterium incognita]|uniref:Long-chain fatty acid--CoA ligase n=1 Tax=Corynebacterium incognita TaxID=2754725 RepID=A0A7G7CMK4_9CORY|nr:long-chain-fatty-acid--CoA ligase [Corynebacterium incognita]QNE88820.1 long-chain fatty acid--CoA ligase [Corynebacterium incognita]